MEGSCFKNLSNWAFYETEFQNNYPHSKITQRMPEEVSKDALETLQRLSLKNPRLFGRLVYPIKKTFKYGVLIFLSPLACSVGVIDNLMKITFYGAASCLLYSFPTLQMRISNSDGESYRKTLVKVSQSFRYMLSDLLPLIIASIGVPVTSLPTNVMVIFPLYAYLFEKNFIDLREYFETGLGRLDLASLPPEEKECLFALYKEIVSPDFCPEGTVSTTRQKLEGNFSPEIKASALKDFCLKIQEFKTKEFKFVGFKLGPVSFDRLEFLRLDEIKSLIKAFDLISWHSLDDNAKTVMLRWKMLVLALYLGGNSEKFSVSDLFASFFREQLFAQFTP